MKWFNPAEYYRQFRGVFKDYKVAAIVIDLFSSIRTWIAAGILSLAQPSWARDMADTAWPITREYSASLAEVVRTFLTTS